MFCSSLYFSPNAHVFNFIGAIESLLLSSCENMLKKDGDALKKSLAVQFEGEVGMVILNSSFNDKPSSFLHN